MKNLFYLFLCICLLASCKKTTEKNSEKPTSEKTADTLKTQNFGIVIHGGAGSIREKNMSDSLKTAYEEKLEEAIRAGHKILADGGSSVDAVRASIKIMENSPLFNAGKGAVFTHDGTNEMDASIMNGENLKAGAVAGVMQVKNPIELAYQVMVNSPHVMLYGKGAEEFAQLQGVELVDPSYFYTQSRYESLQRAKATVKKEKESKKQGQDSHLHGNAFYDSKIEDYKFGTVGCVALDKHGNLAAGTSTGGMTNKRWNRIGDSPIIGAGTYANNKTCAVSCTGWGEYFIRGVAAYDVSAMMEYAGKPLGEAAKKVIHKKLPGEGGGGLIGIDSQGNMIAEFNTPGMFRAFMGEDGEVKVEMFGEEKN
jgi:beta-aspartyl-peptidase (threonine type)